MKRKDTGKTKINMKHERKPLERKLKRQKHKKKAWEKLKQKGKWETNG
jgi:hypothetical protein